MVFKKGNIGGKFKMSYRNKTKSKDFFKEKSLNSEMNKYLKKNFINNCRIFCKFCKIYKKCPYICDYCNGHKVCKEMCGLPKLTIKNLTTHNKIISSYNRHTINITNNDLMKMIPDLSNFF